MSQTYALIAGVLLVAVAVPLWLRKVPPNGLYGLRVPATHADTWVWYEANARSGRDLAGLGLAVILLSAADIRPGARTAMLVGGVLLLAALGWWRANRLLRKRQEDGYRQAPDVVR